LPYETTQIPKSVAPRYQEDPSHENLARLFETASLISRRSCKANGTRHIYSIEWAATAYGQATTMPRVSVQVLFATVASLIYPLIACAPGDKTAASPASRLQETN
jgi:hypothetical protein